MSAASGVARGVRKVHRWVSLVFTLVVIANLVGLVTGSQATWVGLLALPPLLVLLVTGGYLFALPYLTKPGGDGRDAPGAS